MFQIALNLAKWATEKEVLGIHNHVFELAR